MTDYFHIQMHLPSLPFQDTALAEINNYFGLCLFGFAFLVRNKLTNDLKRFSIPLIIFIIYGIFNNYLLDIQKADSMSFRLLKFGMLYLLVILIIKNEDDLIKILETIVAILFIKLLVLNFSKADPTFRLLMFSSIAIYTPVVLILALRSKGMFTTKNIFTKVIFILIVFLPLLSGQRRAIVGLLVLTFLIVLKLRFSMKLVSILIAFAIILPIFLRFVDTDMKARYMTLANIEQISEFFEADGDAAELTSDRKNIWKVYWIEALSSPFLGNGYDMTKQRFGQLSQSKEYGRDFSIKAHNVYLKIFTDYGLFGLVPFLFVVFLVPIKLVPIWRAENKISNSMMFDSAWVFSAIWIIYHVISIFGHEGPYGKEWYMLYGFCASYYSIYRNKYQRCSERIVHNFCNGSKHRGYLRE
ncbi:MAG: O-antigen ligase family protein [Bacteroidetes bacterium]|nr:O-antigen ligase family protein [Bacteroidota bacterium]